jgi:glycogen operon protein
VAAGEEDLHIVMNMSEEDLNVSLPDPMERLWYCAVNTAKPSPADIVERDRQCAIDGDSYRVTPRSVVVFERR